MQKSLIWVIVFLFIGVFMVGAQSVSNKYMVSGENITLNGKLIVFLYPIQNGYTIFSVDGVWVKVSQNNRTVSGNGADFTMSEADSNYAVVSINVQFSCGNGVCEEVESGGGSCCKDCGCLSWYSCVENKCVTATSNACISDNDCNDKNTCTKDSCSGAPRKCLNEPISTCGNGDGCCLNSCNVYTDSDCRTGCSSESQCNDNDPCTTDKCNSGNCTNIGSGGCNLNGACLPNATSTEGSYCFNSAIALQKKANEGCRYDFECISYDCTNKRCKGDVPLADGKKKTVNPLSNMFSGSNNTPLYLILTFGLFVIIIEIRKYIKDKKDGY